MALITKRTSRGFHRTLFAPMLQKITLLKRGNDQRQGTVVSYTLYQVWQSRMSASGETLQGEMDSDHATVWHIPRTQLDRIGVKFLNNLDRIVARGITTGILRTWQPEGDSPIEVKLFETHVDLPCLLANPPNAQDQEA